MTICPYCEQGDIAQAFLKSQPEIIFSYCGECDTVWLYPVIISNTTGMIFEEFMKSMRKTPDWQEIVYT
jgi:uncharacterized protein (DUF983 family)